MACQAICTDCGWSFHDEEFEVVSDAMERHSRKEHHHVKFERAVTVA